MNKRVFFRVLVGFSGLVAAWVYLQASSDREPAAKAKPAVTAGLPADEADASGGGGGAGGAGPDAGAGGDLGLAPPTPGTVETAGDAGNALIDGSQVPKLTGESPKSVTFGVVLVQYAGTQGAKRGSRSRAKATELAGELATVAREDFDAAVKKGDPGSTKNAGRMFRGILEPAPEFVLFSLKKGEVSDPVETPRGFWIVKRIK